MDSSFWTGPIACVQLSQRTIWSALQVRDMREQLAEATRSKEGAELFEALYRSWSHSVGASLCLCFMAQAYGHACDLIAAFSHLPLGVEVLVQVANLQLQLQAYFCLLSQNFTGTHSSRACMWQLHMGETAQCCHYNKS